MARPLPLPECGVGFEEPGAGWRELKEKASWKPIKKSQRSNSGRSGPGSQMWDTLEDFGVV